MDIFLRDCFQRIPERFISILTGKKGVKILDNNFPTVKERKADVVIELEDGSIFHLELQTHSDKNMPLRMLEYYILIKQKYPEKRIQQMVLYVGDGAPRMENSINEDDWFYCYKLKDVKEIHCKELMESPQIEDKILAVLCNVENPENYFDKLFKELLKLPGKERADYIRKLLTALHYRHKLKVVLKRLLEERRMPLTITREMMEKDPFFQEGKLEAQKEAILNLYRELNLSPEKIAKILKVPEELVKNVIEKGNR